MTPLRRVIAAASLGMLSACAGTPQVPVTPAPTSPEATVEQFMAAVNADDLHRMGMLFGDERGPIARTEHDARARDMKLAIMQHVLVNDSVRVRGFEGVPGRASRRRVKVEVFRGDRGRVVPFTLASQRSGGWLVAAIDIEALMPGGGAQPTP